MLLYPNGLPWWSVLSKKIFFPNLDEKTSKVAAYLQIETNTRLDNIQIELYGVCDSALIDQHTKEVKKSKEISSLKCTLQYLRQKGHHDAFRQLLQSAQSTNPNQGMIVKMFS